MTDPPTDPIDQQLYSLVRTESIPRSPRFPSAGVIWWRAQLAQERSRRRKALLPIRLLRGLSSAITAGIAVVFAFRTIMQGLDASALAAAAGIAVIGIWLSIYWAYSKRSFRHE